jgi:arginine utilization protein RocB
VVAGCGEVIPEITLIANSNADKFDGDRNEYTLWSFNQVEDASKISNLIIRFKMNCMEGQNIKALDIPITNGMPFGKNIHKSELTLP